MKTRKVRNHRVFAAGQLWEVGSAVVSHLPDGTEAVSMDELERLHRAIANAICGSDEWLSFEEFEFLCDVTETTFTSAAEHLGLNKSTVSTWRRRGLVPSRLVGNALKRWFWFKLFGDRLAGEQLPLHSFASDLAFLETASRVAIEAHVSDRASIKQAS